MKRFLIFSGLTSLLYPAGLPPQGQPVKVGPAFQSLVDRVQKGDALAMFELRREEMESGCNLPIRYDTIAALKKLVAKEPKNAKAMAYLGIAILDAPGKEVTRSRRDAAAWLRKAAEGGEIKAMIKLSKLHWVGFHEEFPQDKKLATEYAIRAWDITAGKAKNDDVEAMYLLWGVSFGSALPVEKMRNIQPSRIEFLRMAAEKGHVPAMEDYGGWLGGSEDPVRQEEGDKLMEMAASKGSWMAMYHFGNRYYSGIPGRVKKDLKKAWYWWDRMVEILGCDGPLKDIEMDEGGPLQRPGMPPPKRPVRKEID